MNGSVSCASSTRASNSRSRHLRYVDPVSAEAGAFGEEVDLGGPSVQCSERCGDVPCGQGLFQNIPIPAIVVEKVIQLAAARQPEKYDTTEPVPLPFGLKTVGTKGDAFAGHT